MTASIQPSSGDGRNHMLTKRQQDILTYVRESTRRRGYRPSMREIAEAVGLRSTSAVSHQLTILEQKGHLTRGARMPRTVVEKLPAHRAVQERWDEAGEAPADLGSQDMIGVPMFERMAAGDPVIANPESVGTMWFPREMIGFGVFFAVRVVGDSMERVNISDGDWAVVRQQDEAHNGDIVAAMIEDEATVKTFFRASGHTWLIPQNTGYEPIPGDRCRLLGKVVTTISRT
jgi:repressor LexA